MDVFSPGDYIQSHILRFIFYGLRQSRHLSSQLTFSLAFLYSFTTLHADQVTSFYDTHVHTISISFYLSQLVPFLFLIFPFLIIPAHPSQHSHFSNSQYTCLKILKSSSASLFFSKHMLIYYYISFWGCIAQAVEHGLLPYGRRFKS